MNKDVMRQYALRYVESEIGSLEKQLQDLRGVRQEIVSGRRTTVKEARGLANAAANESPRQRSTMSASQRKAVSERMRAYWAERRKNTKKR
jgi:hypothetical protein